MTELRDLHDLLDVSTDRIENPHLAPRALALARRRRTRHRGLLVAAVVGSVVIVVSLVGLLRPQTDVSVPAFVPPTPTATAKPGAFDPSAVDELPAADPGVAPSLPLVVHPPTSATPLAQDPIGVVVLAMRADDAVLLLGTDGSWRSVPPPAPGTDGAALSADGTSLTVDTRSGADLWNLVTGERVSVPLGSPTPAPPVVVSGYGPLTSVQTNGSYLAGVSGTSIVVATRSDLRPTHMLRLVDPEDNYADGKLPVVALLDDGTVLLQVPVFGRPFSWRIVAWNPATGGLSLVTRGVGPVPASYATTAIGEKIP